ncbi:MAG: hypothetical protein H6968_11630 [Chromatiaceae bacterium]|nr:hypothetical protein [Chromatiaceae bacterium]
MTRDRHQGTSTVFALNTAWLLVLVLFAPAAGAADILGGLYRDGVLVEPLVPVPRAALPATAGVPQGIAAPAAQALTPSARFDVPSPSPETHARNVVFARAARRAAAIRDLLRRIDQSPESDAVADRDRLQRLVDAFVATQDGARQTLAGVGERIDELGLDARIQARHRATLAAFEAGSEELAVALEQVINGQPHAVQNALAVMQRLKFSNPPRPINAASPLPDPFQKGRTRDQAEAATTPMVLTATAAPLALPTPADLAETVEVKFTPEIQAKVAELGSSPLAIYEFVRNRVRFQPYLGSRKGAANTLGQLRGNDTDQASLLIALLRAAGIPSRYVRGRISVEPARVTAWLGVDDPLTANDYLATASIDAVAVLDGTDVASFEITHVWVEAYLPYANYRGVGNDTTGKTWIPLDPSFKPLNATVWEDVLTRMDFDADAYLADYIATFTEPSPIEQLQLDVQAYLDANDPGKTIAAIERRTEIAQQALGLLPASPPYGLLAVTDRLSEIEDTQRYKVRFHLYDGATTFIDHTLNLSAFADRRLTIEYVGATAADQTVIDAFGGIYDTPPDLVDVRPVLEVDNVPVASASNAIGMGLTHKADMHFLPPAGGRIEQPLVPDDIIAGNGRAIGFDTFLDIRDTFIDPDPIPADAFLESILHLTAVDYLSRVDRGIETMERLMGVATYLDVSEVIASNQINVTYSFGVPVGFEWTGLYVDADRHILGKFPVDGDYNRVRRPFHIVTGMDGSIQENRVFEDDFGQEAVSTIKILELANDALIPICTITTDIATDCTGFNHPDLVDDVNAALGAGREITIPRDPMTVGLWSGTGYIDMDPVTGSAAYVLSGGINGGSTVESWPTNYPSSCEDSTGNTVIGHGEMRGIDGVSFVPNPPPEVILWADDNSPITFVVEFTCEGMSRLVHLTTNKTKAQMGPGEYQFNSSGWGATVTQALSIVQVDIAAPDGLNTVVGCGPVNYEATFTPQMPSSASYQWNMAPCQPGCGDGLFSQDNTSNVEFTGTVGGNRTVQLEVSNAFGTTHVQKDVRVIQVNKITAEDSGPAGTVVEDSDGSVAVTDYLYVARNDSETIAINVDVTPSTISSAELPTTWELTAEGGTTSMPITFDSAGKLSATIDKDSAGDVVATVNACPGYSKHFGVGIGVLDLELESLDFVDSTSDNNYDLRRDDDSGAFLVPNGEAEWNKNGLREPTVYRINALGKVFASFRSIPEVKNAKLATNIKSIGDAEFTPGGAADDAVTLHFDSNGAAKSVFLSKGQLSDKIGDKTLSLTWIGASLSQRVQQRVFFVFDAEKLVSAEDRYYTKSRLSEAVNWAQGVTGHSSVPNSEPNIAENTTWGLESIIRFGGNQCPVDFAARWDMTQTGGARGDCQAWALLLSDVLKVLGIGPYHLDHVNEVSEPNGLDSLSGGAIFVKGDSTGNYSRLAWGGGIWNNWQGCVKPINGGTCYSAQGPHISTYAIMNNAPSRVKGTSESQQFDNIHAFEYYGWVNDATDELHPTWKPPAEPNDASTTDTR